MLQKCSIFKVLAVFFDEPTKEHYLSEISKKTKLAHTSVKKYLNELKKTNILFEYEQKKGKRIFPVYKADIDKLQYKINKRFFNILKLEESGLIEFLKNELQPRSIILFGSFSKGEDIENSDIDIFIECEKENLELKKFEKKLNRKIEIKFNENFNNYSEELKNSILNGIILRGYLEVFR